MAALVSCSSEFADSDVGGSEPATTTPTETAHPTPDVETIALADLIPRLRQGDLLEPSQFDPHRVSVETLIDKTRKRIEPELGWSPSTIFRSSYCVSRDSIFLDIDEEAHFHTVTAGNLVDMDCDRIISGRIGWSDSLGGIQGRQSDPALLEAAFTVTPEVAFRSGLALDEKSISDFFNYRPNVIVTSPAALNARGDLTISGWAPQDETRKCAYAVNYAYTKYHFGLNVDAQELATLNSLTGLCRSSYKITNVVR